MSVASILDEEETKAQSLSETGESFLNTRRTPAASITASDVRLYDVILVRAVANGITPKDAAKRAFDAIIARRGFVPVFLEPAERGYDS